MKKIRAAKAQGLIPSSNPADTMVRIPRDLKRCMIDSSPFFISSGVGVGEGAGAEDGSFVSSLLTFSYLWINASTLDSVISSGKRVSFPMKILGAIRRFSVGRLSRLERVSFKRFPSGVLM